MSIRIEIPGLRTASEANTRGGWIIAHKRKKAQQARVDWAFLDYQTRHFSFNPPQLPLVVTLTRLGKRALDSDNLAISFKHIRDQIAKWYGVDDGDPRYQWKYEQQKSKQYGVVIEIEPATPHQGKESKQ